MNFKSEPDLIDERTLNLSTVVPTVVVTNTLAYFPEVPKSYISAAIVLRVNALFTVHT